MELFDQSKSIIENLSYLSTTILLLFSFVGIIQIIQTKKALIINSKREAANLAAQQVKEYGDRIGPVMTKYDSALTKDKIQRFNFENAEFTEDEAIRKLGEDVVKQEMIKRLKYGDLLVDAINSLEGFAIYFTKGIADEQIAYSSLGRSFCFSVEHYYLEIAASRDEGDPAFQSTIELYKMWKPRLEKEKLLREQGKINSKMKDLITSTVNPIGTK